MRWRLWLSNQDGSGHWWPDHEHGKLQVRPRQALRKNSEMELQSPLEMCTREPKYLVSRGKMVAKMTTFLKKVWKTLATPSWLISVPSMWNWWKPKWELGLLRRRQTLLAVKGKMSSVTEYLANEQKLGGALTYTHSQKKGHKFLISLCNLFWSSDKTSYPDILHSTCLTLYTVGA